MQFLKKIVNFYIFSNIHVALAGYCITKITVLKYGIQQSYVPFFVAVSIIISYSFIRFIELKSNKLNWLKDWFYYNIKSILILCVTCGVLLLFIVFFTGFNRNSLLTLFPFALMTFFYVIPIFKIKNLEFSFRNFPAVKIFSIAFAWAGITVLFPLNEANVNFSFDVFLDFIQRFALLIVITLPFDIRDLKSDPENLKTLPQVLGVKASKFIGVFLLVFTVGLEFLKNVFVENNLIELLIISFIIGLFLWFSSEKKSRYYTSFWVESIPVYWLILVVYFLDNF